MVGSTTFKVKIEDKELRNELINHIQAYRYTARKLFAEAIITMNAAAETEYTNGRLKIKSDYEKIKIILETLNNAPCKKTTYYSFYKRAAELLPEGVNSTIRAAIVLDIEKAMKQPDLEIVGANGKGVPKGYLAMLGTRGVAQFHNLGMSIVKQTIKLNEEGAEIKFNTNLEPVKIEFTKLDRFRKDVIENIIYKEPGWELCDSRITYIGKDNEIRMFVSYKKPDEIIETVEGRDLNVTFTDFMDRFIIVSDGTDGGASRLSFYGADLILRQLAAKTHRFQGAKDACIGVHQKAYNAINEKLNRNTVRRTRVIKDWNHRFSKYIVGKAVESKAERIVIENLPEQGIFEHPWAMHELKSMINYKAKFHGIKTVDVAEEVRKTLSRIKKDKPSPAEVREKVIARLKSTSQTATA